MTQKSKMNKREKSKLIRTIVIRFLALPIVIVLLVLLPAGTFNYWQVYVYIGILIFLMTFVLFYFLKNDPRFLERRTRTKEKEKQQIVIVVLASITFLSGYAVSGLDKRFGWSNVPMLLTIAADIFILLGYLLIFFVFKQNSYASRILEINNKQKVIQTGLYSVIRHPMYLGVLIMFMPTSIALGSFWGLIPNAILPLILVKRIITEEAFLKRQLPGYQAYCRKTKYRLIPFAW